MSNIRVKYTGSYPALCFGNWEIVVDNKVVVLVSHNDFATYGTYASWHFDADWSEVFEDYTDGLHFSEWKVDPPNGLIGALALKGMEVTDELLLELYSAIQKVDFRTTSCGGCV